jgi:hypothetical protein
MHVRSTHTAHAKLLQLLAWQHTCVPYDGIVCLAQHRRLHAVVMSITSASGSPHWVVTHVHALHACFTPALLPAHSS